MPREFEIDKEEYDIFVRESLNLAPESIITDFHYGVVQNKLTNSELDLYGWLNNFSKNRIEETPVTMPPNTSPSGKPPASSLPRRRSAAPVRRKRGMLHRIWTIVWMLTVALLALYLVGWYLPLEVREDLLKEEWMKSVPKQLTELALFRSNVKDQAITIERGRPIPVVQFESKQPFRMSGQLKLGSPASDRFSLTVEAISTDPAKGFEKSILFESGVREVTLFDEVLPAGEYKVEIDAETVLPQVKLPADFHLKILY